MKQYHNNAKYNYNLSKNKQNFASENMALLQQNATV